MHHLIARTSASRLEHAEFLLATLAAQGAAVNRLRATISAQDEMSTRNNNVRCLFCQANHANGFLFGLITSCSHLFLEHPLLPPTFETLRQQSFRLLLHGSQFSYTLIDISLKFEALLAQHQAILKSLYKARSFLTRHGLDARSKRVEDPGTPGAFLVAAQSYGFAHQRCGDRRILGRG